MWFIDSIASQHRLGTDNTVQINQIYWEENYVCAFLVFLGYLVFWMGMFKVFQPLKIWIPKHILKSVSGPLEQI